MNSLEERHQKELTELRSTISRLCDRLDSSTGVERGLSQTSVDSPADCRVEDGDTFDIVACGTVRENEWEELYTFFDEKCRTVIAFMDDQLYSAAHIVRKHPLMSTVICVIASKAVRPDKYASYLAAADRLISATFSGAVDLHTVQAMMLLVAWTGRHRLWNYIISLAVELGLNRAARSLADVSIEHTADLVGSARTWFSLCSFDLMMNLDRPSAIHNIVDYLSVAARLLVSPHCRPVDYRLCTYLQGFAITAEARAQIPVSELQLHPLPESVAQVLTSLDEKIDRWFYHINNSMEPLYQTFARKQDRNRFMVPYAFLKTYVNGLALRGMETQHGRLDPNRIPFLQIALDSTCLLLQTQFESKDFRQMLPYSGDYNLVTTYHAIDFIPKALRVSRGVVNGGLVLLRLRQGAQMLEEAGATVAASEVREEVQLLEQTMQASSPLEGAAAELDQAVGETLFDIPNLLSE
ncbi:fungal specific transcription factor domain-containing protein [Aspergillus saccharolyticus JOP 1030-1]|uniref:Transcription factor domain-containing protein n=1 Tax=Aspergillus saccharolyticus JOP 1030-1 TaxID=1450539 RepID=A0A318ZKQ2_9EURO|nr:hypothetical protein BP01DRAFT_176009 [Aspergillus saccharolyticus JOP 1030-1]PYH48086.1 hypothetical protein BP01DRAFT_176009 [Aspergillus saccharolyticus JOP 1030-1]